MKIIIMCGGSYGAFNYPRQLAKVNNEALTERTIRLLRELGETDISISTNNTEDFSYLNVPLLVDFNNSYSITKDFNMWAKTGHSGYWVDAFYPINESCIYLCGDVYYTKDALKVILDTQTNDILFFGTCKPFVAGYNKRDEEPLAFKVVNQKRFRECIDYCKKMQDAGKTNRMPLSWELYRVIDNIDINTHRFGPKYVGVKHFAIDVDYPGDEKIVEEIVNKYGYR